MRILILGSNAVNKGAEAMLRTVMAELSSRIHGASFYIGDRRARQWHPEGVHALGIPYAPVEIKRAVPRAGHLLVHGIASPEGLRHWIGNRGQLGYIDALVDQVDLAVDVSGFLFSDQRGKAGKRLVPIVEMFARRGKPFVFLPQAWGPFEKPAVRELAKRAVSASTLTFARDDVSRTYLASLGEGERVEQAPDIAFLFQPDPNGSKLVADLGIDPDRPLVAISPNMRVYERTGGEGLENTYGRALIHIGRRFLSQGVQVLLVPHEILPPSEERYDDRYLCGLIADALDSEHVGAVTTDRSAEEIKAMISACDLMLGSRFHALIAALSSGVPTVAVGWAHKYPELLGEFGLERYVLNHDTLTADDLETAVFEVWNDRATIRESIAATLPGVKARSSRAFDRTHDVVLGKP